VPLQVITIVLMLIGGRAFAVPGERPAEMTEAVRREGLKVVQALTSIETESAVPSTALRRRDFTESEFNSYIAYRIATEKENMMRTLRLKLFDKNRVEGMVLIDLRGQNIPSFLKPEMTFYFEGYVRTEDGRVQLDFRKLFLEGQAIPVATLDIILFIAAKLGKTDPASIRDWYLLPYGIRELDIAPGRISVLY
jgi:hypothetical protein